MILNPTQYYLILWILDIAEYVCSIHNRNEIKTYAPQYEEPANLIC